MLPNIFHNIIHIVSQTLKHQRILIYFDDFALIFYFFILIVLKSKQHSLNRKIRLRFSVLVQSEMFFFKFGNWY